MFDFDLNETSGRLTQTYTRPYSPRKPIHQRPQSTKLHTAHKPIHQRHTAQFHKYTPIQPPQAHIHHKTHPLDASPGPHDVDVDADAQTLQLRTDAVADVDRPPIRLNQQDRIRPNDDQAGLDANQSAIGQARYQTGPNQNQTETDQDHQIRPDRTGSEPRTSGQLNRARHVQDSPPAIEQARQTDQTRSGQARPNPDQAIGFAFDETSRPVFANFSAKPDSTLLRNASRAGAVVGVDVV